MDHLPVGLGAVHRNKLMLEQFVLTVCLFGGISAPAICDGFRLQKLNFEEQTLISDPAVVQKNPQSQRTIGVIRPGDFFPTSIPKKDIFIVGRDVLIDQPLYSYGGNVTIFAEHLTLNAPIDTRPFIHLTVPFWDANYQYWTGNIGPEDRVDMHVLLDPKRSKAKHVAQAFFDWYFWHDVFDEKCKCYSFRGVSIDAYDFAQHEKSLKLANNLRGVTLPILPFGVLRQSDPYVTHGSTGTSAPTRYNKLAFRSGTIRIFAQKVDICSGCARDQYEEKPPPNGDKYDRERKRMLMSAGIKGGRGGLGGMAWCVPYYPPPGVTFSSDCAATWGRRGGVSGAPSRGADGGDIYIHVIDNRALYDSESRGAQYIADCTRKHDCDFLPKDIGNTLAALADYSGGAPSHTELLGTPSFNELSRDAKSKGRSIFATTGVRPRAAIRSREGLFGKPGRLAIDHLAVDEALSQVIAILNQADVDPKYDRAALIQCLAQNRKLASGTDRKHEDCRDASRDLSDPIGRHLVAGFLEDVLVARQRTLLVDLEDYLLTGTVARGSSPDVLAQYPCKTKVSPLGASAIEHVLLQKLCQIDTNRGSAEVESFFISIGGVFRTVESVSVDNLQMQKLLEANGRATTILIGIAEDVKNLRKLLQQAGTDRQLAEYENALRTLSTNLASVQREMAKDEPGFGVTFSLLKSAVDKAKAAYGAYGVSDYGSAASNAYSSVTSVLEFLSMVSNANNSAAELYALSQKYSAEIEVLKAQIADFAGKADEYQKRLTLENSKLLQEYLQQEGLLVTGRRNIRLDFGRFLRLAMQGYSLDSLSSRQELQSNLAAIDELIVKYPFQSLETHATIGVTPCNANDFVLWSKIRDDEQVKCVLLPASAKPYAIYARSPTNRLRSLPLTIVERDLSSATFPANFFGAYRKSDLEWRPAP